MTTIRLRFPFLSFPSRRLWLVPVALCLGWCLLVVGLYIWVCHTEDNHALELAKGQARTLYAQIVDTRAWNSAHGGVYVQESAWSPRNPWLPERQQGIEADGRRLVLLNPAYMTRQIAETSTQTQVHFRISSRNPIRPENLSDPWENEALQTLSERPQEDVFTLARNASGKTVYRYMAPLPVDGSCLACHINANLGEIIGGISVTLEAAPFLNVAADRKQNNAVAFCLLGIVGVFGIGGATWQINRRRFQAEEANRAKTAFLAHIGHDMRTPLSGIVGVLEKLRQECPEQAPVLSQVEASATSLLTTARDIMEHALAEECAENTRCGPLRDHPFSVRACLAACLDAVRPACRHKELNLESRISPDIPELLWGNAYQVRQVVGNLLSNAVKFTRQGGVLLIAQCETMPDAAGLCRLRIDVEDSGPGFSPEEQELMFERFASGGDVAAGQSRGLGLSIARRQARSMGGDVQAMHRQRGSLFRFTLALPFPPAGLHPMKSVLLSEEYEGFATTPLFDRNAAWSMLDGDEALLCQCGLVFLEDIAERRALAKQAWHNGDAAMAYNHVHALKNSGAALGCERLRLCGAMLELELHRGRDMRKLGKLFEIWLLTLDETQEVLSCAFRQTEESESP